MAKVKLNDPGLGKHDPAKGHEHARYVPVLEQYGIDPYVPNGAVIDVPDEVAGVAPFWRRPKEGDELSFMETRRADDGGVVSVHDLGRGLLSQTDIWESVDEKKGDA